MVRLQPVKEDRSMIAGLIRGGIQRSLQGLLGAVVLLTATPALAQSVSVSAGSPTPDPVAVGSAASAGMTATATPPRSQ